MGCLWHSCRDEVELRRLDVLNYAIANGGRHRDRSDQYPGCQPPLTWEFCGPDTGPERYGFVGRRRQTTVRSAMQAPSAQTPHLCLGAFLATVTSPISRATDGFATFNVSDGTTHFARRRENLVVRTSLSAARMTIDHQADTANSQYIIADPSAACAWFLSGRFGRLAFR